MEAFFRGSHTTNFVTWGFNKSYNQAAEVPSSNVTRKSPCSPSITCRIMLAFVSMTHSITTFPAPFLTAIETLSLCTSMPIYLVLVIKGCSFLQGLSQALKTYSKRGALYIASRYRTSAVLELHMYGNGVISNDVDHFKRFSSYFCAHEHTFSHGTRIAFRWLRCFTCVTLTSSGRFRCIDPVLPTKHLFGHDRP